MGVLAYHLSRHLRLHTTSLYVGLNLLWCLAALA